MLSFVIVCDKKDGECEVKIDNAVSRYQNVDECVNAVFEKLKEKKKKIKNHWVVPVYTKKMGHGYCLVVELK
ncbi:MAG: hypothetical protein PHC85_01215 [Candidatus Pacebacteria bacterium]|nr:hypothetical protein [Candidatus Paceibacterota bacterium]